MINVRKSDGSYELYEPSKVKSGIYAAYKHSKQKYDEGLANDIVNNLDIFDGISTADIREMVEDQLMSINKKVARSYIKHGEDLSFIKNRIKYMDEYMDSSDNAASSSETDPNANVTNKNVSNLDGEVYKTTNRASHRYRMRRELKKTSPEVADQYEKDINNHIIYIHDEASSPSVKNYCEAVTLYPLLIDGTKNMDGLNIVAPKNLNSFCGQLVNLTFLLASQCKGAVAFGEFFNFFDYFCTKEFGDDYINHLDDWADTEFVKNRKTIHGKIHQAFQQVIYCWNQPSGNRSSQSPFTNISYYDSGYWHSLFDNFYFPDGTQPSWERVSWLQKDFMKWFNNERSKTLLTFPVETMALLTDGQDVIDKEYKNFTAEMWSEGHSFFLYLSDSPDSLASCCRLRNSLSPDAKEFSFTNGLSGVATGSCNVITLNLNRIIQNYFRSIGNGDPVVKRRNYKTNEFESYFCDIVNRVIKYHIAYKNLLYDVEKKGMLSASTAGYITMDKLFSTIGVNGFNEAAEYVGLKCSCNDDYKEFCQYLTGLISREEDKIMDKKYKMNLEFVPAESLGGKNYNWDREDGYWVPKDRVLYNSYFYLADDPKTSVLDKLRMHGRDFVKNLSGGVGCHINLDSHLSKEQYLKLMDFAIGEGTNYYTFNIKQCSCDHCNHIEKRHFSVCPVCGSEEVTDWTRIIGYLRPVKNFENARKIEESKRIYSKEVE
jgi:ribonucleoside-triphosphate reductase